MRCGNCGSENIIRANAKGRKFMYRKWDDVELKVDLDLLTCQECTNILLAEGDTEALDMAIRKSLSAFTLEAMVVAEKSPVRFQIVKNGPGYQVRIKRFFGWKWLTEMSRKNKFVVSYFQNQEDALKAAEEYVELQVKIAQKKTKAMEVVYDSAKN
jgi:hypothetical protein